ncbi:hypothetical protein AB1N83_014052 [Pleurotus pulmonarius]
MYIRYVVGSSVVESACSPTIPVSTRRHLWTIHTTPSIHHQSLLAAPTPLNRIAYPFSLSRSPQLPSLAVARRRHNLQQGSNSVPPHLASAFPCPTRQSPYTSTHSYVLPSPPSHSFSPSLPSTPFASNRSNPQLYL